MDTEEAGTVIAAALKLARERVTGEADQKEQQRERLADLIVRVGMYEGKPDAEGRPSRGDLTEALGDPDGSVVRAALAAW